MKNIIRKVLKEEFNDINWIKDAGDGRYVHIRAILSYIEESYYEGNTNGLKEYDGVFKLPTSDFIRITKNTELENEEYEIIDPIGESLLNYAYDCELNPDVCEEIDDFTDADKFNTLEGLLFLDYRYNSK